MRSLTVRLTALDDVLAAARQHGLSLGVDGGEVRINRDNPTGTLFRLQRQT